MFRGAPGVLLQKDRIVPLETYKDLAAESEVILIGESHSNPCDHKLQARLIRELAQEGHQLVLGLEMMTIDAQNGLDRFNEGELDLSELSGALEWEESWGYPFSLYRPIFETARKYSIPVVGLNIPSRVVRAVGQMGPDGLEEEDEKYLPGEIIPPLEEQRESLYQQFDLHQIMLDREDDQERKERFLLAQSVWDTVMAREALKAAETTGRKVIVLAGAGHVEYGWGIGHRLKVLDPETRVLTIVPWRGLAKPIHEAGDLFFYCPQTHRSRTGFEVQLQADGLVISDVEPDSRAELAGFVIGDRILSAQGETVTRMVDLHQAAFKARNADVPMKVRVKRESEVVTVELLYDSGN